MVVDVFVGLSVLLNDLCTENDLSFIQTIISEIKELIRFLGPLHLLPPHVTNASSPLGNKVPNFFIMNRSFIIFYASKNV